MRQLIEYMQQIDAGQIYAFTGLLTLFGFGMWAIAECVRSAVQLYADMSGKRKENEQ